MSAPFKIILYVLLVIIAGISGYYALTNFGRMMDRAGNRTSDLEQIEPDRKPVTEEAVVEPTPVVTNRTATSAPMSTNVAAISNALNLLTNQGATTNTNEVAAVEPNPPTQPSEVATAA